MIRMDFYDVVKNRKSIRSYKPDKVPEDALLRVLEAARLAPSWANKQCTRYIVVDDKELIARITTRLSKTFNAPLMIVACADPKQSGQKDGKDYYLVDVGISLEHLVLAAAAEGLGTVWLGALFDEAAVKRELAIPDNLRIVALTPLGYPAEGKLANVVDSIFKTVAGSTNRKPLEEIAFHNRYGTKYK
jgi:nitroreductase